MASGFASFISPLWGWPSRFPGVGPELIIKAGRGFCRRLNALRTTFTRCISAARTKRKRTGRAGMPTSGNPHIAAAEIEAAKEDLIELAFSQEYEAGDAVQSPICRLKPPPVLATRATDCEPASLGQELLSRYRSETATSSCLSGGSERGIHAALSRLSRLERPKRCSRIYPQ
jgi:hypothetical protein